MAGHSKWANIKHRKAAQDVKRGGNLGTDGSVAYLFTRKGQLHFTSGVDEGRLTDAVLEAGADDLRVAGDGSVEMTAPWQDLRAVRSALDAAGFLAEGGEVTMLASTTVAVGVGGAEALIALVDALKDLDDVQNVYTNVDIPDQVMAPLQLACR
jgi:transcriptional/translational regulatory protein YebC/TACO1